MVAARELFATYAAGDYVYAKSPAGYRRLARVVSASSQREPNKRRTLWLVRVRYTQRWHHTGEWLPIERALNPAELRVQRTLGFINASGEPQ